MTGSSVAHAADRLLDAIDRCGAPVCVGIDPVAERVPQAAGSPTPLAPIREFTLGVLDAVTVLVPCVKFQSACYERYRDEGVRVLNEMISEAKSRGLEVILDAKRGDIGVTAEHYAAAAFTGSSVDWVTVNSYLGADGIQPFLVDGRGAFALVRTSNPSGDALQSLALADGSTVADAVAKMVAHEGDRSIGARGYSSLGAVVGATKKEDAARLRALMPRQLFLVPGYGAQGGSVSDVLPCFQRENDGNLRGAVVAASRSVIYAFEQGDSGWVASVRDAAARFADEVGGLVGAR